MTSRHRKVIFRLHPLTLTLILTFPFPNRPILLLLLLILQLIPPYKRTTIVSSSSSSVVFGGGLYWDCDGGSDFTVGDVLELAAVLEDEGFFPTVSGS